MSVSTDRRGRATGALVVAAAGTGLLLAVGLLALGLGWVHAAGTAQVPLQVPALVAALVGLGLVGTALAALDLHVGRRQAAEEAKALESALALVRCWAEPGRSVRTD